MPKDVLAGLVAALQFDLNLLQVLCLVTIVKPWFAPDAKKPFLTVIEAVLEPFYRLIRLVTNRLSPAFDLAPFIFIAILIPLQMVLMLELKTTGTMMSLAAAG